MASLVKRRSIETLTKEEQDNLIRAFAGIQALPPTDPNSYFVIAGYHGEPGSYCNHGNVLFPTWHRAYMHRLEKALQTQVPGIAMAYWDETSHKSLTEGIPQIFLEKQWTYADGTTIANPLFSYKLQEGIVDQTPDDDDWNYTKPAGYETVRYPFSGLVGSPADIQTTAKHNDSLRSKGLDYANSLLNLNIVRWVNNSYNISGPDGNQQQSAGVRDDYNKCLDAPNYTVFSNLTSAQRWNDDNADSTGATVATSVEQPHNNMHVVIGGLEIPGQEGSGGGFNVADQGQQQPTPATLDANGDMGENETAAFDPIFYFHHCYIDMLFAKWQIRKGQTTQVEIIEGYDGAVADDSGAALTLDTPLDPFKRSDGGDGEPMTSRDLIDWTRLGYTYEFPGETHPAAAAAADHHTTSRGRTAAAPAAAAAAATTTTSLFTARSVPPLPPVNTSTSSATNPTVHEALRTPAPVVRVSHINRAAIKGSFLISAWATPGQQQRQQQPKKDGEDKSSSSSTTATTAHATPAARPADPNPHPKPKPILVGTEAILSRWRTSRCANCRNHLEVKAHIPLHGWSKEEAEKATVEVKLHTRQNPRGVTIGVAGPGEGQGGAGGGQGQGQGHDGHGGQAPIGHGGGGGGVRHAPQFRLSTGHLE